MTDSRWVDTPEHLSTPAAPPAATGDPGTPDEPETPDEPPSLSRALWRARSLAARTARGVLPPAVLHRLEPFVRAQERRWWRGGRDGVGWAVRVAGAAAAGYLVARLLLPGSTPLVAALTALLVVQLTPVSLLANGALRIVAVVMGVAIAAVFAASVALSWWSLALAVVVAALAGQLLRLGDNVVEVPISTLLVLSAGQFGYGSAASHRIVESLLGAAVGIVITMVVPPRIVSDDAGKALAETTDGVSDLLLRSSWELTGTDDVPSAARGWLGEARTQTRWLPWATTAVDAAQESRRLNLRALALADTGPGLRQGLVAIEASLITVRSTYRSLLDVVDGTTWDSDELSEEVKASTALVLREASVAVGAFGDLVAAQARRPDVGPPAPLRRLSRARHHHVRRPAGPERPLSARPGPLTRAARPSPQAPSAPAALRERAALRTGLAGLRDARVRLTELVLVDRSDFAELNVTLLACVRRLLVELDLDQRDRVMATAPGRVLPRLVERRAQGRLTEAAPAQDRRAPAEPEQVPVAAEPPGPASTPTPASAHEGPAGTRSVGVLTVRRRLLRRRPPRLSPPGASAPTGPGTPGPASREG